MKSDGESIIFLLVFQMLLHLFLVRRKTHTVSRKLFDLFENCLQIMTSVLGIHINYSMGIEIPPNLVHNFQAENKSPGKKLKTLNISQTIGPILIKFSLELSHRV